MYPPSKDVRPREHRRKEIKFCELTVVAVSYLVYYDTLLQNATDIITKCNNYFITKCDKYLLQNSSASFLQNATVLLQIATFITKCFNL